LIGALNLLSYKLDLNDMESNIYTNFEFELGMKYYYRIPSLQ
jgi:hypothetical protein